MRLMRETDRSAKEVALESGFGSGVRFGEILHDATGLRPRAWRKKHALKK